LIPQRLPHALVLLSCAALTACDAERPRPNVLVLLSDDQATGTLSCEGHEVLRTPAIDRIAAEGALFTNAFVTTSLCSPSRVSFFTGQWARTHGIITNSQPLTEEVETFATILAASGYETAYFGKWHMGNQRGPRPGFTRSISYNGQGDYHDCTFVVDGQRTPSRGFVDDVATDYLIAYLGAQREQPFAAVLGFKSAHGPREPAERFAQQFADVKLDAPPNADDMAPFPRKDEWESMAAAADTEMGAFAPSEHWREGFERSRAPGWYGDDQRERLRDYWRLIAGIDENVGRILDALDELELADDTIVVYASDNGFANGEHGMSGKRSAYEESMRIPFVLRYPPLGARDPIDELVLNVDLAPTLLELCRVAIPEAMQGRSLVPLLSGETVEWRRDFLYEYFRESDHDPDGWFAYASPTLLAVRTDAPSKLVVYPDYPTWTEYFQLDSDPFERSNAADAMDGVAALRARLAELEAALGPRPEPTAGPAAESGE
jgi:arylsulfatase A-like enzyme